MYKCMFFIPKNMTARSSLLDVGNFSTCNLFQVALATKLCQEYFFASLNQSLKTILQNWHTIVPQGADLGSHYMWAHSQAVF